SPARPVTLFPYTTLFRSEVGEVRLAGFEQPERLFQVVADGLPETFAEPRAARPWRDEQPALLERAEELTAVDAAIAGAQRGAGRSEEHTSELQSLAYLVC